MRPGCSVGKTAWSMGARRDALTRCLSLDLEVGRADDRIHAIAGVRPDTGQTVAIPRVGRNPAPALARLDELSDGADFLLGHNLIDFDLPHLRAANPNLRLLDLPAVDTLRLNPLAFPRNPYHHLVKHYQDGSLIRGRLNDPELDARLVLEVFENQQRAFRETGPELLTAWHWLTTTDGGTGFDLFFTSLRQTARPSATEARAAIHTCLAGSGCRVQAGQVVEDSAQQGWEMAYALAWLSVSGSNSVMPPWVRHQFPGAGRLVRQGRDRPCGDGGCDWCRERPRRPRRTVPLVQVSTTSVPSPPARMAGHVAADNRRGGHGGRAPAGDPAHRGRQVAVLPAASPVALRQDRRPDGGDIPPGGSHGRPGRGTECPGHWLMRHRERHAVHAGAGRRAGTDPPGRRRHRDHFAGTAAQRVPEARPGPAGDRLLGAGRGPLPVQVGA